MIAKHKNNDDGSVTSRVIELLRFPMIVGIVFIHGIVDQQAGMGSDAPLPVYNFISELFSEILVRGFVPMFFLISGFLFFYKVETFGSKEYLRKLKSRFRTLFLPYMFWNLLVFVIFFLVLNYDAIARILPVNHAENANYFPVCLYSVPDYSSNFLTVPISGQFWFIRDLMWLVVFSPLINFFVTRTRHFGIILLTISFILCVQVPFVERYGMSFRGLYFFTVGAWCARERGNLEWIARDLKFLAWIWPVTVIINILQVLDVISLSETVYVTVLRINIVTSVVMLLCMAVYLCRRYKLNGAGLLSASSFFIFAAHLYFLQSPARKLVWAFVKPETDGGYLLVYFVHIALAVVGGVLIYKIMVIILPKPLAFITGGRIHNCSKTVRQT